LLISAIGLTDKTAQKSSRFSFGHWITSVIIYACYLLLMRTDPFIY